MTPRAWSRAALASVALLGGVIATLASSSASGASDVRLLVSPPGRVPTGPAVKPGRDGACVLPSGSGSPSNLELTGGCEGIISTSFACLAAIDDLYLSARVPVDPERYFYLTINVESFKGPRRYGQVQIVAQLTGPAGVERWSGRDATVSVRADHAVQVAPDRLPAEPGTGATGTIQVSGSAGCAA